MRPIAAGSALLVGLLTGAQAAPLQNDPGRSLDLKLAQFLEPAPFLPTPVFPPAVRGGHPGLPASDIPDYVGLKGGVEMEGGGGADPHVGYVVPFHSVPSVEGEKITVGQFSIACPLDGQRDPYFEFSFDEDHPFRSDWAHLNVPQHTVRINGVELAASVEQGNIFVDLKDENAAVVNFIFDEALKPGPYEFVVETNFGGTFRNLVIGL